MSALSSITVDPVRTHRDYETFVHLPWHVPRDREIVRPMREFQRHLFDRGRRFRGNLSLAAQIDGMLLGKDNPFYEHGDLELFLAKANGRPIARIVAIHNRLHNEHNHDQVGFFGFYECIDSGEDGREATRALVESASDWLHERGLTSIRGPFNPTINDDCGVWLEGDNYPSFLMPSNPRYYGSLLESAGMSRIKTMFVYRLRFADLPSGKWERLVKMFERIQRSSNVHLRAANFKDLDAEVKSFLTIYNTALANNWGFAPMSFQELRSMAELFQYLIDSNLIRAAEVDENGKREVAGASISVPDLNEYLRYSNGRLLHPVTLWNLLRMKLGKGSTKRVRIVFLGVRPDFRHTPASMLLLFDSVYQAKEFGAEEVEASWVLEDNVAMRQPLDDYNFKATDQYAIFERAIS